MFSRHPNARGWGLPRSDGTAGNDGCVVVISYRWKDAVQLQSTSSVQSLFQDLTSRVPSESFERSISSEYRLGTQFQSQFLLHLT